MTGETCELAFDESALTDEARNLATRLWNVLLNHLQLAHNYTKGEQLSQENGHWFLAQYFRAFRWLLRTREQQSAFEQFFDDW